MARKRKSSKKPLDAKRDSGSSEIFGREEDIYSIQTEPDLVEVNADLLCRAWGEVGRAILERRQQKTHETQK